MHLETGRHLYGGGAQVLHLVRGLVDRDEDPLLVAPDGSGIAREAAARGLPVETLPFSGEGDLAFVGRFRALLKRVRPELVHLHSRRGADTLGLAAARWAGIPVVLSRRVDNREAAWVVRLKYPRYRRVIAISEEIRRVLLSEGVAPDLVVTVRSAVDPAKIPHECRNREAFLEEMGLPRDARVAGMAAQLIQRKGHHVLLDAVPVVLAAVPRARFLLFGRGPLEAELRRDIAARGLQDAVRLAGFRDDLPHLLPCLDLLVHPAFKEGLGVALLEAGAAGIPVVGSRAGGIPEVVVDGRTGLLVPPGDAQALAAALTDLLGDPERCAAMGRQARRFVEKERSVDAMVEGNLAVYRAVLAEASAN
ncbi:MAG TPA: glycosyltransferase [Longimicrobiales bacterium]|nr:glycosyltransferase [Longimicrobiales bacterium]